MATLRSNRTVLASETASTTAGREGRSIRCAVIATVALIWCMRADAQQSLAEVDSLITTLEQQQKWLNGRAITVELDGWSDVMRVQDGDGGPEKPDSPEQQVSSLIAQATESDETYRARLLYRLARLDTRYRCDRFRGDRDTTCLEANPIAETIFTFDGANYISVLRDVNGGELYTVSADGKEQRPDPGILDLCGWWVFGQSDLRLTFADYLRWPTALISVEQSTESGFRVVCQPKRDVPQTVFEFVCRRTDGHVELAEAHMRVYIAGDKPRTDGNIRLWSSVYFDPIRWNDGERISRHARLRWLFVADERSKSNWAMNRLTVCTVEEIDAAKAREILHPQPSPKAAVTDARYQIGYRCGDTTLNIDGRLLDTHEPLHGDVGQRLEWWISKGKWVPVLNPATGNFEEEGTGLGRDNGNTHEK